MSLAAAGAFLGGTGVIAGAFGSHYLRSRMTEDRQRSWQIAVHYQLLHAVAIFSSGLLLRTLAGDKQRQLQRAMMLWAAGTGIFSGSIYLLCLGYKGVLGPLTPVGGLLMIAGWGVAAVAAL